VDWLNTKPTTFTYETSLPPEQNVSGAGAENGAERAQKSDERDLKKYGGVGAERWGVTERGVGGERKLPPFPLRSVHMICLSPKENCIGSGNKYRRQAAHTQSVSTHNSRQVNTGSTERKARHH